MQDAPTILAFDTSGAYCAVALMIGNEVTEECFEEMAKGQAERLFPMIDEVLGREGVVWEELDAIAVGTGPGNFTGIRIGVSAARGLALSLGKPALGVSAFEVAGHDIEAFDAEHVFLKAPQNRLYWQRLDKDDLAQAPSVIDQTELVAHNYLDPPFAIGRDQDLLETYPLGDAKISANAPAHAIADQPARSASIIAAIAASRLASGAPTPSPTPLYVRTADAVPPSDPPPVILPNDT